jgi:hypothetical protein
MTRLDETRRDERKAKEADESAYQAKMRQVRAVSDFIVLKARAKAKYRA